MSRRIRTAGVLICLALVAAATAVAAPRIHTTKLPPPLALPTSMAVDEKEWSIVPSRRVVASGQVSMRVYNRGMDDHDLSLVDSNGVLHRVYLEPKGTQVITATLTPGTYRLWCSLFEGTPASHVLLGMETTIEARPDPILLPAAPSY